MADKEITSLTDASTPLSGDESLHVVQGGNSREARARDISRGMGSQVPFLGVDASVYTTNPGTGTITTITGTANRILAMPIIIPYRYTFTKMAMVVTTAAASTTARLAIYNVNDSNGGPGTLVVDASTIDVSSTGIKEATINQTLNPGMYHLLFWSQSATPAYRAWPATSGNVLGCGVTFSGTTAVAISRLHRDVGSYGGSFGDESGNTWSFSTAVAWPIIGLR